jgi:hypothetical protein
MERTNPAVDETVTPSQIHPRPIIDIKFPFYLELEKKFIVTGVRAAALAGLAITPLPASALIAACAFSVWKAGCRGFLTLSSRSTRRRGPRRPPRHWLRFC